MSTPLAIFPDGYRQLLKLIAIVEGKMFGQILDEKCLHLCSDTSLILVFLALPLVYNESSQLVKVENTVMIYTSLKKCSRLKSINHERWDLMDLWVGLY